MDVNGFFGQHRWLSNFWYVDIVHEGKLYPSAEHMYQEAKTTNPEEAEAIRNANTCREAKKLGQHCSLRHDWNDSAKLQVMENVLRLKFKPGTELSKMLIDTGEGILREDNTWGDRFWGFYKGEGDNHLGRLLMKLRKELNSAK